MPVNNAVVHFERELREKIEYFREEYDISYAEAIGVLEIVKALLLRETIEDV